MTTKQYLASLAEALGLAKAPQAIRDSLVEEIDTVVFRSVLFRVFTDLDEDDKDELHDILEKTGDDFEKPFAFLAKKIPHLPKIVEEEVEKVKSESEELLEQFV